MQQKKQQKNFNTHCILTYHVKQNNSRHSNQQNKSPQHIILSERQCSQSSPNFFYKVQILKYRTSWYFAKKIPQHVISTGALAKWRDLITIICLQIIVSPVKDLYKNKKSIYNCNVIIQNTFFLYILCIFDKFTFAKAKV